jgi:alpha-amylase/alpha-mannosidase (GH57 family)
VNEANRVLDIVNNYEKISFNVGPTLMVWLEGNARHVYDGIQAADRASVAARGHGNAIAQVYGHVIMPLATRRDKVTQVRWGIEDFRARFGRDPEGLWLPETAVDEETLEVLAEAGLTFTILAPHQAWRVRPLGGDDEAWEETKEGGGVDPGRAYLWRGPRGLTLALFFYDGDISRAIAFEGLLERGEHLVARIRAAFSEARPDTQLVHCATDGESYGHHQRFGEMALAAAVAEIERDGFAELTNYAAFLADHPPTHEAQIRPKTSWSCAHGVERWRADCGCRLRPEGHQRWRAPLRETLDWLRDQVDVVYEGRASARLKDPWAARDAYIEVVLDRDPGRRRAFLERHQRAPLDAGAEVEARRLLEMQRQRLLMFTSCGWFFDEISGLEPVQILRHAALALTYLRDLGAGDLEPELLRRLAAAPSNVAEYGDGAGVYRRLVSPAVVEPARVVAHYAITGLFQAHGNDARVYTYHVARLDEAREADGATALRVGHVRLLSEITGEAREASYALLHVGGREVTCAVRAEDGPSSYDTMKADLRRHYARGNLPEVARGFDEHFPGERYGLPHLFLAERRRLLACLPEAASGLRDAVRGALGAVEDEPSRERVAEAVALVEAAGRLGLGFDRWTAQNRFFALWRARPDSHAVLLPLAAALGFDLGPRDADPRG